MEELGATAEELETDVTIKGLDKVIQDLKEVRSELKDTYKNLTSKKYQNEQFQEFLKSRENTVEVEEKIKEEKKKQKKEWEAEEAVIVEDDEQVINTTSEEAVTEAKKETNNVFDKLESIISQTEKDDKDGKNTSKSNFFGDKEADVNTAGSATVTNGKVVYPMGVSDPALLELFPELKNAMPVTIFKKKDNEGNDIYDIVAFGPDGSRLPIPTVGKYNVDNETTPEIAPTEVIDDSINNLDMAFDNLTNKEMSRKSEAMHTTAETGEQGDLYGKKNTGIIKRKHVKLVESTDPMITSSNFKEFRESPRDKTDEKVGFQLGNPGNNVESKKAIDAFNNGIANGKEFSRDELNHFVKFLPIMVTFDNGIYTHLFFVDRS
jgi:hypothetical protein